MANKVIIDVEARFHDSMAPGIDRAIAKAEKLERAAAKVADIMEKLNKMQNKSSFEIKDKASAVLEKIAQKLKKLLGQKKWEFLVSLKDKASAGLQKIADRLKKILGQKRWDFLVGLKDKISAPLQKIINKLRHINKEKIAIRINVAQNVFKRVAELSAKLGALSKNAWNVLVGLKDKATNGLSKISGIVKALVATPYRVTVSLLDKITAPLRKIKSALSSVAGIVGIGLGTAGIAQTVSMYAGREDLTAQFKVLLGSQKAAEDRLAELTTFAGQTPFTRDEIFQASRVLETYTEGALSTPDAPGGLRMIGDIAAATGRDYNSVATYMARLYNEIKRGGESLGEPLMYLREMGAVSADAEEKIQEIAAGSGTVEEKWAAIAEQFSRFDGMMLEMSNQMNNLLLGVKSFLTNNFLMKIGEGITSQLKPFLIDFRAWRNENGDLISSWAKSTKEFAALLSGKVLNTIRTIASNSFELFSSDDFKAASMVGKIGMIWEKIIADPLVEWWSNRGKGLFESKAREMGLFLGDGLTKGLKALLSGDFHSVTASIFPTIGTFLQGFFANFDAPEILESIKNFAANLPKAFENLKLKWDEYIGAPFKAWWQTGGKEQFEEFASMIGDWLGTGITKGVQFLSDGILGILGLKDSGGIVGEAADIGKSFWDSFTASFDGSAITKAIVDAISGVWSALPFWAKMLVGGYAVSKAASFLAPIANLAGGIGNIGKGVAAGFGNTAKGIGTVGTGLGQGASLSYYAGAGLFNLGSKAYTLLGGTALTGGTAALAGLGAVAGGAIGAYGLYDAGTDLYAAYKAHKSGDKATRDFNLTTGVSKAGGLAAGAAIGTMIAPGVGTLIGAGIGYLGGKLFGDKMARSAQAARYESEEMQAAVKDSSKSAEELACEFEKAKKQNLADHFGKMELSLEEIQAIAKNIVFGENAEALEEFSSAAKQADQSFSSMKSSASDLNKLDWKASLGYRFSEDEQAEFLSSVDSYINNAKQYLEDKHYEVTCAIDLLFEDGETKTTMTENVNTYYNNLQEQLDSATTDLKAKYKLALENDGVITVDEAETIAEARQKVQEIIDKISNAEQQAELQAIEIKFSGLSVESFDELQTQLAEYIESAAVTYDEALTATLTNLNLQLADGVITQEEYDKQLQEAIAGYNAKIEKLNADVAGVQLNFLGDAYSEELGADAAEKLQTLLDDCLKNNQDPLEMTIEDIKAVVGEDVALAEEDAANLMERLSSVFSQMQIEEPTGVEVPVEPEPKVVDGGEGEDGGGVASEVQSQVETKLEETIKPVEPTVEVLPNYITGETSETFKIEDHSLDTTAKADVTVNTSYDRTPKEMTVEPLTDETTADVTVDTEYIRTPSEPTWPKFTGETTASVTVKTTYNVTGGGTDGNPLTPWANGGIVTGPTPSLIGEAGPEAIIPLSTSRRERGLALWQKAGQMLGVLENANGGIYDGSSEDITGGSESTTTTSMRSFVGGTEGNSTQEVSISSNDSNNIDVHVGGITIQVNSSDGSVVNAIKENIDEITEEVAGVLKNALAAQFKNMPARS